MSKKNIGDLRDLLFSAIEDVKAGTLAVDRAKVIGELAQVMVNTAKVEVDYAKATGQNGTVFLQEPEELPVGITGIRRHRIGG